MTTMTLPRTLHELARTISLKVERVLQIAEQTDLCEFDLKVEHAIGRELDPRELDDLENLLRAIERRDAVHYIMTRSHNRRDGSHTVIVKVTLKRNLLD